MSTTTFDEMALATGKTFVWHELYTGNLDTALNFYKEALDFGTHEMDMGPMGTYKMLTKNGNPICGAVDTNSLPMKDIPPHWATYLAVDDVDARLAKCQELGATVVVPPMDVPTVGRMTLIQDPTGAHIWLFTPNMNQQ